MSNQQGVAGVPFASEQSEFLIRLFPLRTEKLI